jgi:phosphonate degradation associated HDIG domain protein
MIDDIIGLYRAKGGREYEGEGISQLEHALQSAQLAERAGAPPELVCAALLHDIGHLLNDKGETPTLRGVDDLHQYVALPFLRQVFPEAVLGPIRLHVDAKRYLCRVDDRYWDSLSPASKHSLELQGGSFDTIAADRFLARAFSWDAIRLRRWDDLAKVPGRATLTLRGIEPVLRSLEHRQAEPSLALAGTLSASG